ncbi:MAG: Ig-like domain-containing protein [Eubacteriales bacterium]|nr:Ig-like domain-containing protein [Eubacteriales bacterium]
MEKMKKLISLLLMCVIIGAGSAQVVQIISPLEVEAAVQVAAPKLISVKESGTAKAVVKWNSVKGVNGYRVYRKTDGQNWKALKTIAGAAKVSYTDSGLKTGTRYYYTVKAYKNSGGKTVWSSYDKKGLNLIAGLSKLKLNKTALTLQKGKTYTLKLSAATPAPKWTSSNTNVAAVSSKGKVTAKNKGTATITAALGGKKFTCKVTVTASNTATGMTKLKNYILKNGITNSDGNRFIKGEIYDDGIFSWAIIYEAAKKRFCFLCMTDLNDSGTESALNMYVNAGDINYLNPEFLFIAKDYVLGFSATAKFKASSYTGKNSVYFSVTSSTGGVSDQNIQKLANTNLQIAFAGWQELLQIYVGISLRDIGFTSYY